MEIIKIKTEDAKDWVYKGEGAANVILSYLGSSPNSIGKESRVQKVPKEQKKTETLSALLSMHEQLVWGDVAELFESKSKDNLVQNYTKYVMCPLLGTNHIDTGVRVSVSREFLDQIEMRNLDLRPVWRVNASKIDTFTDSALLIFDHSVFPGMKYKHAVLQFKGTGEVSTIREARTAHLLTKIRRYFMQAAVELLRSLAIKSFQLVQIP